MLKGLRTAETAMNIQLTRTNTLANNLANVNTTGFKRMLTQVVEDMKAEGGDPAAGTPAAPTSAPGSRIPRDLILDMRAPIDDSQGPLRETGNPLDFAIKGDGMFKVRREGRDLYTRNGSFGINENRQLVTSAGDLVIGTGGPIELPDGDVQVSPKGAVLVGGVEVSALSLTRFDDPGQLKHIGNSLMSPPRGDGGQPVPAQEMEIVQGMLEDSNVDPIETLVGMIAAQRAFEMQAKILQAEDRTLEKAVNQLSSQA